MRRTVEVLAVVALTALVACADAPSDTTSSVSPERSDSEPAGSEPTGVASSEPTADPDDAALTVRLNDFWIKAPATAKVGDEVIVHNASPAVHRHDWVSEEGGFATEVLEAREMTTVTLERAGTFDYVCTIHRDVMKGTITVEPS